MILTYANGLSIGNFPFLKNLGIFPKITIFSHSGIFPIDVFSLENKYISMNKTKLKEDILLVLITLIGLFLFLAIYLTFNTSIYKIFF